MKFFRDLIIKEIIIDLNQDAKIKIEILENQVKQITKDYVELEIEFKKACDQILELEDIAEAAGNIWNGRAAREKLAELIAKYNSD